MSIGDHMKWYVLPSRRPWLDVGGVGSHPVADAPRVITRGDPGLRVHLVPLAVDLDPPGTHADLMEPHEVGGHPIARADVRAVLGARGQYALEAPVEGDGLHFVSLEDEANGLQGRVDLVADRPDRGELGLGQQPAAGPYGDLLHTSGDAGIRIDDVPVDVLPETEAELQAAVLRCRHRAHLL